MERVETLIRRLRTAGDARNDGARACAAWPVAVGKRIAVHAEAMRLTNGRLTVDVEDHVWQRTLSSLSAEILAKLEHILGSGVVESLDFHVVPAKKFREAGVPKTPTRPYRSALGDKRIEEAVEETVGEEVIEDVLNGYYTALRRA